MNTLAHIAINLALLTRRRSARAKLDVTAGAVLPDAPMFLFYGYHKLVLGTPEMQVWRTEYFRPSWQNFIDVFNSLPLISLGLGVALLGRSPLLAVFFASMLLHVFGDLPLHHDDAHRHLFPLSDWRFESPLSYWDPAYHGELISVLEIIAVLLCCVWLLRVDRDRVTIALVSVLGGAYVAFWVFAMSVWSGA